MDSGPPLNLSTALNSVTAIQQAEERNEAYGSSFDSVNICVEVVESLGNSLDKQPNSGESVLYEIRWS